MIPLFAVLLAAAPLAATQATLVVEVVDQEAAADALVAKTEALGGYFQGRSTGALTLRVPSGAEDEVLSLAAAQGTVVEKSLSKEDVREALEQLRGQVRAREEMLKRYQEVLTDAGPQQVVSVERAILEQVAALEKVKGSLRVLDHRVAFARLTVRFRFTDRRAPPRMGRSSFAWLNSVSLSGLLAGFAR